MSNCKKYCRVAELIKKARSEYRTSKEISQDDYITILAPGNTAK